MGMLGVDEGRGDRPVATLMTVGKMSGWFGLFVSSDAERQRGSR